MELRVLGVLGVVEDGYINCHREEEWLFLGVLLDFGMMVKGVGEVLKKLDRIGVGVADSVIHVLKKRDSLLLQAEPVKKLGSLSDQS